MTECVCERGEMESQAGLGSSGAQSERELTNVLGEIL